MRTVENPHVVVVGAGPAGSLVARELARGGASVLLVDRESFPRWKVCGGCLSTGALTLLDGVGVGEVVRDRGGTHLERMILSTPSRSAHIPLPGSHALSRSALDLALLEAAEAAGVVVQTGVRARWSEADGARRRGLRLRRTTPAAVGRAPDPATLVSPSLVVDASGLGGMGDGAERVDPKARVGLGALFPPDALSEAALPYGTLRMITGRTGYVGLVRVERGVVNLAAAVDPGALRALGPSPLVTALLDPVGMVPEGIEAPMEGWKGTRPLTRRAAGAAEPEVFRIGDALGYVEPFTGEGMNWALAGALALAPLVLEALRTGESLEAARRWDRYRNRESARARRLCRLLAWGLRRPPLVEGSVTLLRSLPSLARPLVRRASLPPLPMVR